MTIEQRNSLLTRGYSVELQEEEDGSWTVLAPDLPGCVSAGHTPHEALDDIGYAIDAWVEAASSVGRPIPTPSRVLDEYSGRFVVRLPRSVHRAAAHRAEREGVSLNVYCTTAITEAVTRGLVATSIARSRSLSGSMATRDLFISTPTSGTASAWVVQLKSIPAAEPETPAGLEPGRARRAISEFARTRA